MRKDTAFATGEIYHLYNRGAHKQDIFTCTADYKRFMLLLYLANDIVPVDIRQLSRKYSGQNLENVFQQDIRDTQTVNIYAYSLMPNHFHLVLRQVEDNGITNFCRKLLTGYSMYFNKIYNHSGILAQGSVKSKHVDSDEYFRYIFSYVHLNPLSLYFPCWESKGLSNKARVRRSLSSYLYSSYYDYAVKTRPQSSILSIDNAPDFLKNQNDLEELLSACEGLTSAHH